MPSSNRIFSTQGSNLCLLCLLYWQAVFYPVAEGVEGWWTVSVLYLLHCCLVAELCLILCVHMDFSTPGFPVLHHFPEFAQMHVH